MCLCLCIWACMCAETGLYTYTGKKKAWVTSYIILAHSFQYRISPWTWDSCFLGEAGSQPSASVSIPIGTGVTDICRIPGLCECWGLHTASDDCETSAPNSRANEDIIVNRVFSPIYLITEKCFVSIAQCSPARVVLNISQAWWHMTFCLLKIIFFMKYILIMVPLSQLLPSPLPPHPPNFTPSISSLENKEANK